MRNKAFSLIEMLLVLVIISLLTMSLFPVLRRQISSARMARIVEDLEVIAEAGAAYYRATGSTPGSLNDLVAGGYMGNISMNPYGNPYLLQTATADRIIVRTTVPSGLIPSRMDSRLTITGGALSDTVDFTQLVEYTLPEKTFEKQHLYEP